MMIALLLASVSSGIGLWMLGYTYKSKANNDEVTCCENNQFAAAVITEVGQEESSNDLYYDDKSSYEGGYGSTLSCFDLEVALFYDCDEGAKGGLNPIEESKMTYNHPWCSTPQASERSNTYIFEG